MKLLVCGGRDYRNYDLVKKKIVEIMPEVVIHGAAKGADTLADVAAESLGIDREAYPAQWKKYGPRAGPIRNQQMLDEAKPDMVLAFPGGKGTADMIKRARKAGIKVEEVQDALLS